MAYDVGNLGRHESFECVAAEFVFLVGIHSAICDIDLIRAYLLTPSRLMDGGSIILSC